MSKYVDITLKDKSWLFPGSVVTHHCPPTQDCSRCGGSGRCPKCAGKGEIRCSKCGGRGELKCSTCGGSGWDNINKKACYFCKGSGTVRCFYCGGQGFNKCSFCDGSGNCWTCGGSGQVTCARCKGTGFYQTYLKYVAHYCVRQYCNPGPTPDLLEGLRLATGEELCNYVAKYWQKSDIIQFDNTNRCFDKVVITSGNYSQFAENFREEYSQIPEMTQEIRGYKPYMNTLRSNKVPCTRVKYTINEREYEIVFVGTNGVVCYKEVPKSLKVFDLSPVEKAYLKRNAYKRHYALAALTAYIFNLDGMDASESKHINLLLKHMCLNSLTRDRKVKYLKQRYLPDIPAERMLDKVKCLLSSKKTICYVWQCIAIDKKVSSAELAFFNKLVTRYGLTDNEVNNLKKYSAKFSTLEDDQFVKEYLDSPAVYRDPNFRLWNFLIILSAILSVVSLIVAINLKNDADIWTLFILFLGATIFLFVKKNPFTIYDQKSVDRVCGTVSREMDLSEADYIQFTLPYRIWYKIVDVQIMIVAKIGLLMDKLREKIHPR